MRHERLIPGRPGFVLVGLVSVLLLLGQWARPTLASFSDRAEMSAGFALASGPSKVTAVAIGPQGSGAIALAGSRAAVMDMADGWRAISDAPFAPTMAAACSDQYLVTDGERWAAWSPSTGWSARPAPFPRTAVLAGTDTCAATDGKAWAIASGAGDSWTPVPDSWPASAEIILAASQKGQDLLASTGYELWFSHDLGATWTLATKPPNPTLRPFVAGNDLAYVDNSWYEPDGDLGVWKPSFHLNFMQLGQPLAAGSDDAGWVLMTDGDSWLVANRENGMMSYLPNPPL